MRDSQSVTFPVVIKKFNGSVPYFSLVLDHSMNESLQSGIL